MFSMRNFVKSGFISAVGKLADYQIILNAAGWGEKGVLVEDDLADIQTAIDEKNAALAAAAEAAALADQEPEYEAGETEPEESAADRSEDSEV